MKPALIHRIKSGWNFHFRLHQTNLLEAIRSGFQIGSRRKGFSNSAEGSALIALAATIVVFGVLAVAIVPMISSSSRQSAIVHMASKAYLLAESGYRYAASEFLHAGADERNQNDILEQLDNGVYELSDGDSKFELHVHSFFYELSNDITGGPTQFTARAPGTFPSATVDLSQAGNRRVRIGDDTYILQSAQLKGGTDDQVEFESTTPLLSYPRDTMVFPVALVHLDQNLSNGILIYKSDDGLMFPQRNGQIQVNGRTLVYRFNDKTNNRFRGVHDPTGTDLDGFNVSDQMPIVLNRFARLRSIGIVGSADDQIRREVTYHAPLPLSDATTQQKEFTDRFDGAEAGDWQEVSGSHTIGEVGSNNALQVESTFTQGAEQGSLIQFNPASDAAKEIDFNASRRGSKGFLSYDAQIKVGYETLPAPDNVTAGLSFRLSNIDALGGSSNDLFQSNGFGLSFVTGNDIADSGFDHVIGPVYDQHTLVLWEQTDNGTQRRWLAVKDMHEISEVHIWEDFETTNKFHQEVSTRWDPDFENQRSGSTRNWYYGHDTNRNYAFDDLLGVIESDPIDIPDTASQIILSFWSWHETEPHRSDGPGGYDRKQVFIRVDEGDPQLVHTIDRGPAPGIWYLEKVPLSDAHRNHSIRIQFSFDAVDNQYNNYEGWYVDDVRVYSTESWPIQNSTLGVRLKEAMVVRFDAGTAEIQEGDRIFGTTQGTYGRVIDRPIIDNDGLWTTENPSSGTLLLNRTSVTSSEAFVAGEELYVMGGAGRAIVKSYSDNTDRKANIISVYFASESGHGDGNGNTDPFDRTTRPYPRLASMDETLKWPSTVDQNGNWPEETDFFRFIRWDQINPEIGSGFSGISLMTAAHGLVENAILQRYHQDLKTPDYPNIFDSAEIGLHTFGEGSTQVYFDDFGILLSVAQDTILTLPVQE